MVKKAATKPKISIRHLEKYVEELRSIGVPRESYYQTIEERVLLRSLRIL